MSATEAVRGVMPRTAFFESIFRNAQDQDMEYSLNPFVFLCPSNRYVVMLDVHRDRYACVLRDQFELLAPWLDGWQDAPSAARPDRSDRPHGIAAEVARTLVSQGILTLDASNSKPVRPVRVPSPRTGMACIQPPTHRAILRRTPAFFLACRRAHIALQRDRFVTVLTRVAARHSLDGRHHVVTGASKVQAARLVAIFAALRLFYPRPYLCTFDSLALLEFLAAYALYPRWIFGVRADPFHAHCWVQYGETVLNDRIEHVTRLSPILAV